MHDFRMLGVGGNVDTVPRTKQKLVSVHVHDEIALENDANFIKRVAMIFDVGVCGKRLELGSQAFVHQKHFQLLGSGEALTCPSIDKHAPTMPWLRPDVTRQGWLNPLKSSKNVSSRGVFHDVGSSFQPRFETRGPGLLSA